ncbi:ester cyclase [Rhizobium sp. BR 250]
MGRRNLDHMRALDTAWNRRQWSDYAALLDDDLVAWRSGELESHGKQEHVLRAQRFCAAYPASRVQEQYLDFFLSADGHKTCSIAVLSDITDGKAPAFEVTFSAICTWRDGRVVEQREYVDDQLFQEHLHEYMLTTETNHE